MRISLDKPEREEDIKDLSGPLLVQEAFSVLLEGIYRVRLSTIPVKDGRRPENVLRYGVGDLFDELEESPLLCLVLD